MFTAILMICDVITRQCFEAHDDWGPYATKVECVERVETMKEQIELKIGSFKVIAYQCNQGDNA